jgi:hypothetical protein
MPVLNNRKVLFLDVKYIIIDYRYSKMKRRNNSLSPSVGRGSATARILLMLMTGLSACKKEKDIMNNLPTCIVDEIQAIKKESVWNPPATIWQYQYDGQIVYYIPPRCCDITSILVNEKCNVICHPDGGVSGTGDGNCSDFFEKRTDEKLIWKDERSYLY